MGPLAAAAVGITAFSQYASAQTNKNIARNEAGYAQQKSQFDQERTERQQKIARGRMAAILNKAGRGFTGTEPSTGLDLLAEQVGQDELDILAIQ